MPYRLRVTAGPSLDLSTHNLIQINNDDCPLEIQSPRFRGRITVRVKGFAGITDATLSGAKGQRKSSSYFDDKTATFSLQCQGQYGDPVERDSLTADDIMFGIVLREPLNQTPPLGLGLIERTMRFFWPVMESNLHDPTPWVLSPMFATMSRIHIQVGTDPVDQDPCLCCPAQKYFREALATRRSRCELLPWPGIMPDAESENVLPFLQSRHICRSRASSLSSSSPPSPSLTRPVSPVFSTRRSLFRPSSYFPRIPSAPPHAPPIPRTPKERKKYFASPVMRKQTRIEPTDVITTDFRNSFIDFRDLSLAVPGVPFKIDLSRHMVGRPTQYVCRSRAGVVYWAIVFTILEDRS